MGAPPMMEHAKQAQLADSYLVSGDWNAYQSAVRERAQVHATLAVYGALTELLEQVGRGQQVFEVHLGEGQVTTTPEVREALRKAGLVKRDVSDEVVLVDGADPEDVVDAEVVDIANGPPETIVTPASTPQEVAAELAKERRGRG